MLLKLDLEKAFDKLEWSFIKNTLHYFNIPAPLISLIMSSISILINGTRTNYFQPSRGIRQGDPLSPYLFIMSLERLSRNIFQSVDYLLWKSIQLSCKGPQLSHLFFADDIILLSKVNNTSFHSNIDTLNTFTTLSRQTINFQKSKIFFFKELPPTRQKSYPFML